MTGAPGSAPLRAARDALVADTTLGGVYFGRALADLVDASLRAVLVDFADQAVALVALGSYARRELCPGSDLDVLLVYEDPADVAAIADACWYPLWDAGFVLGHATRTVKDSRRLAATDLDTLTGLLEARVVGGAASGAAEALIADVTAQARKRGPALVAELAQASVLRRHRPGHVAEMLEPNIKDGAGGLRDVQALRWAGATVGPEGGFAALAAIDAIHHDDLEMLEAANEILLDVRVALHRVTGVRSDVLALQEQDAVAEAVGAEDADALVRRLAGAARRVAWVADDAWARLAEKPARRRRRGSVAVGRGLEVRSGRVVFGDSAPPPVSGGVVLEVARVAVETGSRIDRSTLAAMRNLETVAWDDQARGDLFAVLGAGRPLIEVCEALDHEHLLRLVLPEWEDVRWLPQRNSYHRFTVDRHLLEAVAEAAVLLDEPEPRWARVVDELAQPEVLLLGALLHDIAKGQAGDHTLVGADSARVIGERIGLAGAVVDDLVWLVRRHLLMADTATRRDLADPVAIEQFGDEVATEERLRLLTLLTVADSRATGPAAWGAGKAALVAELYDRTQSWFEGRAPAPDRGVIEPLVDALSAPGVIVEWDRLADGNWQCAVGADDRPGLLAGVAGGLSLVGFDIVSATAHSLPDGRAAEIFVGSDTFDRLGDETGQKRATETIEGVLAGSVPLEEGLAARREVYGDTEVRDPSTEVRIKVFQEASADSTVVEVFAPDEIGLLATVAGVLADLDFDVTVAKVSTTGELAVDVFYVRDRGGKIESAARIAELERGLRLALTRG